MLDTYNNLASNTYSLPNSLEKSFSQKDPFELAQLMRKNLNSELVILEMLKTEIVPKCRHLKKYHDRTKNGILYCINCNMDL